VINSNAFGFRGSRLNAAIYRVRPDGSGLRRLTRPSWPSNDILASPSPAGNRVVFVSDRRYPDLCCNDLYVMRSDGSGLHRVPTGDLNGVGNPDWGSAPRDAGTGAATVATSQRALTQAGSSASAARRCADRNLVAASRSGAGHTSALAKRRAGQP
jgi:hypothetical protein